MSGSSRKQLRRAWWTHVCLTTVILLGGMLRNGDTRKYIPIRLFQWQGNTCRRAFANVLATTAEQEGAILCCHDGITTSEWTHPCTPAQVLPLAGRLTKFPDAWFIPLLPWGLRLLLQVVVLRQHMHRPNLVLSALQRLGLYLGILMIRSWILYLGLNAVEGWFGLPIMQGTDPCWYDDWLRLGMPTCHGRLFDYSDHVVLYVVQILTVVWLEFLDAYHESEVPSVDRNSNGVIKWYGLLPLVVYLHVITYVGLYKTVRWFHTGGETLAAYFVSLLIVFPLVEWQSSTTSRITSSPPP